MFVLSDYLPFVCASEITVVILQLCCVSYNGLLIFIFWLSFFVLHSNIIQISNGFRQVVDNSFANLLRIFYFGFVFFFFE